MNDITIEKILSDSRNLERVLDNLKDGIIAHDMERRIFYINKKAEDITGYSKDDVLGRDCHEALGGPLCGNKCSFCGETKVSEELSEYSININTKSGETRNVEMTAILMKDEDGRNCGILASFKDITDIVSLRFRVGELNSFSNIIGRDSKMLQVFQQIRDVALYDMSVNIYGETGTGKELVAKAIHNESHRSGAPFVPINCGALPEGLIESELFGHVKGSFSGAVRDKKGRFELAANGSIFLDEVAELPKNVQVKLLRFLQEGSIEKVGSEKTILVDARVISATNKDLKKEVKKGTFREDLYYRLDVIPVSIPPLRQRKNDIPLLANHFLQQIYDRYGHKQYAISDASIALMLDYEWPGNVRQLENAMQFAAIKCKGNEIMPHELPMELSELQSDGIKRGPSKKLDIEIVKTALGKAGGNKAKAARLLGVGRATLYRFLDDNVDIDPGTF
ncbi:MAG: sigma 54-interacting transcriptional regulator [Desulfobacteraceae bacterium]|jgi:sigma-54 dependent transcriptional regulator, acetoin dehydrogenase operon transcriptional activator AcoR|nr:sigma 54-interacting transcriptional regulator [Desulfobacteraceae bacterium]MBT4363008.1 sigma 54-interacting transcriptional regulator [Desulfobacteraceae bacterium]